MTRLELLVAVSLFALVCVLAIAPSGFDQVVGSAPLDSGPLGLLVPYQRFFFCLAAGCVTLVGLLLEGGRRHDVARDSQQAEQSASASADEPGITH